MLASILILFSLPSKDIALIKSPKLRPISNFFFIVFCFNFLFLGFLGGSPAEEPYILLSRISSILYFSHFIIIIPILSKFENKIFLSFLLKN
jgi:quinol-cytochrome oxidoreductase complex cytochrome b subunit